MQKRGLSGVVATVLLVMLTVVAVGVVWGSVRTVLDRGTDDIKDGFSLDGLKITRVEIVDGLVANVSVMKEAGAGKADGVKIILSNGAESQSFRAEEVIEELETKTFNIPLQIQPTKVVAYPFVMEGTKEKVGKIPSILEEFEVSSVGMIAYYPFEGDARDFSGSRRSGQTVGSLDFVEGKLGKAAKFDGINDKVVIESSLIPQTSGNGEFSLAFWMKPEELRDAVIAKREWNYLQLNPAGLISSDYAGLSSFSSTSPLNVGEWYFITLVYDGAPDFAGDLPVLNLYINGNAVASREFSGFSAVPATNIVIGTDGTSFYKGEIDELRLYDKALTSEEVSLLMKI